MIKFLQENYFIPLYGIALVIALYRYPKYFDSVLKYFPIIIGYTLLSEVLGYLIRDHEDFQLVYFGNYNYANYIIFNIYDVVVFLYFYRLYWKLVQSKSSKSIIKYGAILYIASTLINPFFQNVFIFPQIFASTVGSVILVITILLYFKQLNFNKESTKRLTFWISIGLLVFNLFFPVILITGRFDYEFYQKFNFRQIHYFLIVAMYTSFIIGFIRMRRFKE